MIAEAEQALLSGPDELPMEGRSLFRVGHCPSAGIRPGASRDAAVVRAAPAAGGLTADAARRQRAIVATKGSPCPSAEGGFVSSSCRFRAPNGLQSFLLSEVFADSVNFFSSDLLIRWSASRGFHESQRTLNGATGIDSCIEGLSGANRPPR